MIVTKRFDTSHAITIDYYENGVDSNSEERKGFEGIEDREMQLVHLAEAGDALETYSNLIELEGKSNAEVTRMIFQIDHIIDSAREAKPEGIAV